MLPSGEGPLRRLILVGDAGLVILAIALAGLSQAVLRDSLGWFREPPRFDQYALIVYLSIPLWLSLVAMFGLHRTFERTWSQAALLYGLLKLHLTGLIALATVVFLTQTVINRSLIALFLFWSFGLFYVTRSALEHWRRYQYGAGRAKLRLLLVGAPKEAAAFAQSVRSSALPPDVVGLLGPAASSGLAHFGGLESLDRVLHEQALDYVLFFPPYDQPGDVADAVRACELVGVPAGFAISLVQPTDAAPQIVERFGRPFVSFEASPKSPERLAIKHAFDWMFAAAAIVLLSPLLGIVSLAILATMGRPVFFTQPRAGVHGRSFRLFKFRTMATDAEPRRAALLPANEMNGPVFKLSDDPRVTRLGRWLRRTSIDELPQLLNVLAGSMSLVGPRPLPIKEQQEIKGWHRRRLSMKPGMTGIWQISGRSELDFEEWMRLDERYVSEWSLWLDLVILAKTLPAVLSGRGAR